MDMNEQNIKTSVTMSMLGHTHSEVKAVCSKNWQV